MSTPVTTDPLDLNTIKAALGTGALVLGGSPDTGWGQSVDSNSVLGLMMGGAPSLATGITDVASAIESVSTWLLTLPLEVLQGMQRVMPGADASLFGDVETAVATIIGAIATPALATLDMFTGFVQLIMTALSGGNLTTELQQLITGLPVVGQLFAGFTDVMKLLGLPTGIGTGSPTLPGIGDIPLLGPLLSGGLLNGDLVPGLSDLSAEMKQVFDIVQGLLVTPINDAVQAFKDWFSSIGQQFTTTDNTFSGLFSGLWGGLKQQSATTAKSAADVSNAAADTAVQVQSSVDIGELNNQVLSIRNNKSLMTGIDETEESNFLLSELFSGGADPTAVISATAASVPVAYWRAEQIAKKGFISWFGKGFTSVTELRLDIYRANYTTSTWDLIHTSPNLISMVGSSWTYLVYNIASEAQRLNTNPGEVWGVAWRVVGTGTHSIGGKSAGSWYDSAGHPTVVPAKPASTRTGSGALAFGSTTYANNIPWFGIGIISGDVPPPTLAPRTQSFTVPMPSATDETPGLFTYNIPVEFQVAGTLIDLVGIGGGGGGSSFVGAATGNGGYAGTWGGRTLVYGTDIPLGTTQIKISVSPGNRNVTYGGSDPNGGDGVAASTVFTLPDGTVLLTCVGGASGSSFNSLGNPGQSAGDFTWAGKPYSGGLGGSGTRNGNTPGGGAGGGVYPSAGGHGAPGEGWITVRQS